MTCRLPHRSLRSLASVFDKRDPLVCPPNDCSRSIQTFLVRALTIRCLAVLLALLPGICCSQETPKLLQPHIESATKRWAKAIDAFDKRNAAEPDPEDGILFIGSSSIRRWESIATDMAPYATIRRGYGGAKYTDMAVFVERLVTPHQYRSLVMFVGNGVTGSSRDHSPDLIESLTRHIVSVSHNHAPDAPVFLIEITPCERRFSAWPKIRAVNARLREVALSTKNTYFISTASHYLDADGNPRSEYFVEDKLHLNDKGYKLWARLIRRRLDEMLQANH